MCVSVVVCVCVLLQKKINHHEDSFFISLFRKPSSGNSRTTSYHTRTPLIIFQFYIQHFTFLGHFKLNFLSHNLNTVSSRERSLCLSVVDGGLVICYLSRQTNFDFDGGGFNSTFKGQVSQRKRNLTLAVP